MKNGLQFLVLAAFCLFGFASCKKEGHGENKSVTLNVTVNAGDTYKLDLSPYGDEDDVASIAKQAADYNISAINTDTYTWSVPVAAALLPPALENVYTYFLL